MAARGQTVLDDIDLSGLPQSTQAKALRYWFDDDDGSVKTVNNLSGQYSLDVSGLIEGLHTLHYQVLDDKDKVAYISSTVFMKMGAKESSSVQSLRYWFDDDNASVKTIESTGIYALDVSALIDGFHTIHYQVKGCDGMASYIASGLFFKTGNSLGPETVKASKLIYWFDDETAVQNVDMVQGVQMLDASGLTEGLHTLHYQVLCNNGQITPAMSSLFMKMSSDVETAVAKSLRYWFDDEQKAVEIDITTGVQLLDASGLIDGLHTVHYQITNSNGTLGAPCSSIFLKMNASASTVAKSLRYWFDDDPATVATTSVAGGTQTLDVSSIPVGLHTLNYQLIDSDGKVGIPMTGIFFKTFDKVLAEGENRVTKYQYWLNTNSAAMQAVELANAANPYTLITLLPMQKEPIQSSQFHFEVTNDVPTIYAKNTLHVRFFDAQNYFSDGEKMFVDYAVKQEVTDVTLLESGVRETTNRPGENEIKWYKVEAEKGDSLAFKANYPCTLQLFSPTGDELCTMSGTGVLDYSGSYAPEGGTYYLALHDVTSQNCLSVDIDYLHIDKYAVLSYSPSNLGILPAAQVVQLNGNGYDKLTSATLRLAEKQITVEGIYPDGKSEAELLFVLQGNEEKGVYDLVLTFEEDGVSEELTVPEAITLSIPDFSDFEITITDPRTVANPYPVSVSITNKGNLTYSDIPFVMAYDNVENISELSFLNFEVEADTALVNNGLNFVYDIDDFKGKGIRAKMIPTIISVLRPGETLTIKLGFKAGNHATYNVYAWAGTPWSLYAYETMTAIQALAVSGTGFTGGGAGGSGSGSGGSGSGSGGSGSGSGGSGSGSGGSGSGSGASGSGGIVITLPGGGAGGNGSGGVGSSCMPDPCDIAGFFGGLQECLCGTAMGLGTTLGGIQLALQNRHNRAQREQLAASGLFDNPYDYFPDHRLPHPGDILRKWAEHCLPGNAGKAASAFNDQMDMMGHDPCPDPDPHPCDQYNPGDPNDIFGYMAESGSKFMKEGTTDVFTQRAVPGIA